MVLKIQWISSVLGKSSLSLLGEHMAGAGRGHLAARSYRESVRSKREGTNWVGSFKVWENSHLLGLT